MNRKQAMCFVVTLFIFATFSILPIDGQTCPWCDISMQSTFLDCVNTEFISRYELRTVSLQDIEQIKKQVTLYSASLDDMPYNVKKLKMDEKFTHEMVKLIKKYNYQNNHAIVDVISDLAGNCYSLVTGFDPNVVIQDIKQMIEEDMRKKTPPPEENSNNRNPNSRRPYSSNQNQQSNFQHSNPQVQPPLNNVPFFSPLLPPGNFFDNYPFVNDVPFDSPTLRPVNYFDDHPFKNNDYLNPSEYSPINSFGSPSSVKNAPFNHHVSPSKNPPSNPFVNVLEPPKNLQSKNYERQKHSPSSGNPKSMNNAPFNPRGSPPANSVKNASFNNHVSQPRNPSDKPSIANDFSGPFKNLPSDNYKKPRQAKSDFSKNRALADGRPDSSLKNHKKSNGYKNSPDNAAFASTASPKISPLSENSKPTDSDSSGNLKWTPSTKTDEPPKTAGKEKSNKEKPPCDEKFKIILYEKLFNNDKFCTFLKTSISATKHEIPKIINHAFKEYGIIQHYSEFRTFWGFDSKALNKESTVEDWIEIITKNMKIIFSRNNLLKEDCEEAGKKMAGYILDTFPEDPADSSTEIANQNDENVNSNSTDNALAEDDFDSEKHTGSGNHSLPELSSILKHDKSIKQSDSDNYLSDMLSKFETQENLEIIYNAAENCISPSGFDFKKFLKTMTKVKDSIQTNHPDWSDDKCKKQMLSATTAVLAKIIQDKQKNDNKNAESQSLTSHPDSVVDASSSQSLNSDAQPEVPNNLSSGNSIYPGQGTDLFSNRLSNPQQDFTNYGDNAGPNNRPPSGNQPDPGYWNAGLIQPSNFAPGPVNRNYGDSGQPDFARDSSDPQSSNADTQPEVPNMNLSSDDLTYPGQGTDFHSNRFSHPQDFRNYGDNAGPNNTPPSGNQPDPDDWNTGLIQPSNFAPGPVNSNLQSAPFLEPNNQFPPQDYPIDTPTIVKAPPYSENQPLPDSQNTGFQQSPNFPNVNFKNNQFQSDNLGNDYFNAGPFAAQPALPNDNSQNALPYYDSGFPPVGSNYNTQPGLNPNYNSGVPANEPANSQW